MNAALDIAPELVPYINYQDFIAQFKHNCNCYPLEFSEQQLNPPRRITSARKDPLNGMVFALERVHIL